MGRKLSYKPGSFYRACERTGFVVRAEHTRKEWTNRFIREESYENRQPQDLVRGVYDWQNSPEPRPLPPDRFINQSPTTPTGEIQVYGDSPLGTSFLVQNQEGPAYNTGLNSGNLNPNGTAEYDQINGTVPAVTPASLNQSMNRGPGAE